MRRRVLPFVTALSAVAVFATGCGVTDDGPRPGIAAEVDGETLSLKQVDDAVQEYCTLRAAHADAVPASKASIRSQFVLGWSQAVAVERLAPEYDVALPPDAISPATVEENWGELGKIDDDNYDEFEWLTWIQERLTDPVESLGSRKLEEEDGQGAVGQQAVDRGIALIQEWLEDNEPELNPVFGELDEKTGAFGGDALSVPVSDEAKAAAGEPSEQQIANLPDDQRCGPPVAPVEPPA